MVFVLAATGCSGGHANARSRAASLCEKQLGAGVVSSSPTTVGDVRGLAGGAAGAAIASDAFPRARASAFAAWCWTATRTRFFAHAVTAGFAPWGNISYDRADGMPTPSGPPQIR